MITVIVVQIILPVVCYFVGVAIGVQLERRR